MLRWSVIVMVLVLAPALADAKPKPPASGKDATPIEAAPSAPAASDGEAADDAEDEGVPEIPHRVGPATIELGDGVEIELPAGFRLYERAEARRMLEEGGDDSDGVLAVIETDASMWTAVVAMSPVGYVSDHDAAALDAEGLLASLRLGTIEQNRVRVAKGVPELIVDGWSHPPSYDRARRELRWGLNAHSTEGPVLNMFTNVLGRRGYLVIDLITPPDLLDAAEREAAPAIAGLRFQAGSRYEDYQPGVDPDSGMSLTNLIIGGSVVAAAGSKVGLFAKIVLVLKKVAIAIAAVVAGAFKWIKGKLGGRGDGDAPAA